MELPACANKQPPVTTAATTTERGREIIIAPLASFEHIQQPAEKARLFLPLLGIVGSGLRLLRRRGLGVMRRLRRDLARGTPGYRRGSRRAIVVRTGDLRQRLLCCRGWPSRGRRRRRGRVPARRSGDAEPSAVQRASP